MTKDMFTFLMGFTTILALIAMGLLFSDVGALIYPISLALFAAVQAPFFIRLKKTEDEAKKGKLRLIMVLIMLVPIVVALVAIIAVVAALTAYYAS